MNERSESQAVAKAVQLGKAHYRCPHCRGWHLTSGIQIAPAPDQQNGEE